jgi:citrate lyase subunit beta / citryl-CoA lyase
MTTNSPRDVLFEDGDAAPVLPVCDHYAGVEPRMSKSLQLQADMAGPGGAVFDVTLDNEDGATVGGEVDHAHLIVSLLAGPLNRHGRVGVRLLPLVHPRFADVARVVLASPRAPAYLMLPKPRALADVQQAAQAIDAMGGRAIPLHTLIETHGALRDVFAIAAHPRIQSLSFGLMDFVSAHRGAIPQTAMGGAGQFEHPLVMRAKLEIAAACHAAAKVPSHCVFTEFKDLAALQVAARTARLQLGYTRMWSIHPAQIAPIVQAFSPSGAELEQALAIITAAQAAGWAPIGHAGPDGRPTLHDRASYRYFWHVIERARRSPLAGEIPAALRQAWFGADGEAAG